MDDDGELCHLKYGRKWPRRGEHTLLDVELYCFLNPGSPEKGGRSKFEHAKAAADLLWNYDPENPAFIWTPEALKMTQEACDHKYLGICGAASSGKSHFAAMWALLNFYAAPTRTMVLVTSTSVHGAKQRVWGHIQKLWNAMPVDLRGLSKMVGSNGILRYNEVDDNKAQTDTRGITIVAAEQKQDKEAVAKLIGRKQERMFLIADELPELSHSINTAAKGNLVTNNAFQYIALGNPKDFFDAFGNFCKPLKGWDSINETMTEWDIRNGKVVRFDALKYTNYVTGKQVYSFMPSRETIDEAREEFGENSLTFYRMYRGYFPPSGASDNIYDAIELMASNGSSVEWKSPPSKCAGLDLSFTSGGDKTVLTILEVGQDKDGKTVVRYKIAHVLKENIFQKDETRTFQICKQVKDILVMEGIEPRYLGYDSTGGGAPFGDALALVLNSRELLPVQFAGKASDRVGRGTDRRPAHERYTDKMSEIWFQGRELMRGKQFCELSEDLMSEMTQRSYRHGVRGRVTVLPKSEMKLTTGKSPDRSDSFMLALEVAYARLHLHSQESGRFTYSDRDFDTMARDMDLVGLSNNGVPEWTPIAA